MGRILSKAAALLVLGLVVGCGRQVTEFAFDAGSVPDACSTPCGATCCVEAEVCVGGESCCRPGCEGRRCGDDGCGGSCGTCETGWTCNAEKGACECPAESDEAFCARLGAVCGTATGKDACGRERTVACDRCGAGQHCEPSSGTCACDETDAQLCQRLAKECGTLTATDLCGGSRTVAECGPCSTGLRCEANACVCPPEDDAVVCANYNAACGELTATDNCGVQRTIESCGTCPSDKACDAATHACLCKPETNEELCLANARRCGELEVLDRCGAARLVPCGACLAGEVCTPSGSCRLCTPQSDADFCRSHDAYCGTVNAPDNCDLPRTATCGTCDAWASCLPSNACYDGSRPTNDTCAQPARIPLTANGTGGLTATVAGDTAMANMDMIGSCNHNLSGTDVVYVFTVPPGPKMVLKLDVTPDAGSAFAANPSVRTSCTAQSTEIACAYAVRSTDTASIDANNLAPGDYYVWVDGWGYNSNGPFAMTVTLTPAPPVPPNDTCSAPETINLASGSATATGDLTSAADDYSGTCAVMNGGDVVYRFTLSSAADIAAAVTGLAASPTLNPSLYLRSACNSGVEAAPRTCVVAPTGTASLLAHDLQPGTYHLIVDSTRNNFGPFSLSVQALPPVPPPANDLCVGATPLALGPNETVTEMGTTVAATDDSTGSCAAMVGGDVVYALTLNAPALVTATVTRDSSTPAFVPAIYIRTGCNSSALNDEKACTRDDSYSGSASVTANLLAMGTYYIVVDGIDGTEGRFTLTVDTATAIPNLTCAGAMPLVPDPVTKVITVTSDTRYGSDSMTSSCNPTATGREVVFSFEVGALPKTATIVATPLPGSAIEVNPSVRRAPCAAGSSYMNEIACGYATSNTSAVTLKLRNLSQGTYYIWVDGRTRSSNGPFALSLTLTDPPPVAANDTCAGAIALVPDASGVATASGDTDGATGDYSGSCASSSGGDVVYSIDLATYQSLTVTVAPTTGSILEPVVYLRSACGTAGSEVGCSYDSTPGAATQLTFPRLAPRLYFLVVDSYSANDGGGFVLTAQTNPPIPAPTHDQCAGAMPLTWSGNRASVTGQNTMFASDDETSYCSVAGSPLTGPDLVYAFTLNAAAQVTAKVTPGAGNAVYRPAVSIRSSCAPADELACARDSNGTSTVTVSLVPGSYVVIVDGVTTAVSGTDFGPFTLELTRAPPVAADGCGNPLPISIDPNTGIGLVTGTLVGGATDSGDGSCRTSTGSDLVYALTLSSEKTVDVSLHSPNGSTALYYPTVYLRTSCANPATELACSYELSTAPTGFTLRRLPAGTYYLWVDSYSAGGQGPFELAVTTTTPSQPAPGNDDCRAAQQLVIDGPSGGASVLGDTTWASPDYNGACASSNEPFSGPEVVYSFTLTQAATVFATVARHESAPTSFDPALYLRAACADWATELACTGTTPAAVASMTRLLQPGTYYLFVDGQHGSSGTFVLNVGALTSVPTANDTCTPAKALTFDASGVAVAIGSTAGLTDGGVGSCATGSAAPDAVYSFTFGGVRRVTVDVNPLSPDLHPVLYVRSTCGSRASERGCAFASNYAGAELHLGNLNPGTYYVFVDGYGTSSGPFALAVRAEQGSPTPPNDACQGATAVAINPTTGKGTITGNTRDAMDDYVSNCSIGSTLLIGPDLVYSFTLSSPAKVTAKVTRDASNGLYKPAVSIRRSCASTDEVACALDSSGVSSATATLQAGEAYVFVDGVSGSNSESPFGPFTLEISTSPTFVTGDDCGDPIPLTLDPTTGTAIVTGALTAASNDSEGSCTYGTGNDLVYSLTLPAEKTVQVSLEDQGGTVVTLPVVYLRGSCTNPNTELACAVDTSASGLPATWKINRVPAGTYYLFVDTGPNSNGLFRLTVTATNPLAPAPANDICRAATPIVLDPTSHAAHLTGDLSWATNDYLGSCGTASYPFTGPDVVYSLTLTQASWVYAMLGHEPGSDWFPALHVRTSCADEATEVACAMNGGGAVATLVKQLQPGTYSFIVDGQQGTAGPYDFDVVLRATTTSSNDTCATAETLTFDANGVAVAAGTTAGLGSDYAGSCWSMSGSSADVVYQFTLASQKDVTVGMLPDAAGYPMIYLQTACGMASTEVACARELSAAPVRLQKRLQAGTYYLIVDGSYSSGPGPFSVSVTAAAPVFAANDTCAGAVALPFSGVYPQTRTLTAVDLQQANDDYSGSCAPSTGPDLAYALSVPAPARLTAVVTPNASSSYKPAVYLRSRCPSAAVADELSCARTTTGGSAVTLTVPTLAAGTYYLIVDGSVTTRTEVPGKFDLSVTLEIPVTPAPSNDSCSCAQVIALGAQGTTTTLTGQTTLNASHESSGSCGTSGAAPDVVYTFTLTSLGKIIAKVTPDVGSTYQPAVYLHAANCGGLGRANELACGSAPSPGSPATATKDGLHPGQYFLWVDSNASTAPDMAGDFTLEVTLEQATRSPPSNDDCTGVMALTFDVPYSDSTSFANNDFDWGRSNYPGCQPQQWTFMADGADVVFSYTPTTDGWFKAQVDASWNPHIWIGEGGACGDLRTCVGSSGVTTAPKYVTVNGVARTTYWIYLDGSATGAGPYTVKIMAP